MKKDREQVLNNIWYFKISPFGFFNKMEIVMFPDNEPTFTGQNFDFEAFELFLKSHVENKPNQICFPKSCWKIKGKPQPIWMKKWLQSKSFKIRTDIKIGEGGQYSIPPSLLRKKDELKPE